jgi:hypothetical protein
MSKELDQIADKEHYQYKDKKVVEYTPKKPEYKFGTSHMFDVGIAQAYGINEAIILNNMIHWLKYKQANKLDYHDGHYWVYNSIAAYHQLLPYLSEKQIRHALDKLENEGVIKTANYNKLPFDRTKWYTIIDESLCTFWQMELYDVPNESLPDGINESCTKGQTNTIYKPYINPNSKQVNQDDKSSLSNKQLEDITNKDNITNTNTIKEKKKEKDSTSGGRVAATDIEKVMRAYPLKTAGKGSQERYTKRSVFNKKKLENLIKKHGVDYILEVINLYVNSQDGRYLQNFSTFINQFPAKEDFMQEHVDITSPVYDCDWKPMWEEVS